MSEKILGPDISAKVPLQGGHQGRSPLVPGSWGRGSLRLVVESWGVSPQGLPWFPRCPGAELPLLSTDDSMEGVDSERRPHFPQFSYSASGTA